MIWKKRVTRLWLLATLALPIAAQQPVVRPEDVDYVYTKGKRIQLTELKDAGYFRISGRAKLAKDPRIRGDLESALRILPGGPSSDEFAVRLSEGRTPEAQVAMEAVGREAQQLRAFKIGRFDTIYIEYPEVVLKCAANSTLAQVKDYLDKHYQVEVKPTGLEPGQFLIRVLTPKQTLWLANQLESTTALPVEYAEVNFRLARPASFAPKPALLDQFPAPVPSYPSDPGFSLQWGLMNPGVPSKWPGAVKGADLGFAHAWKKGPLDASGMKVAVLDYAIDVDHPDLKDSIDREARFNALQYQGSFDNPLLKNLAFAEQPEESSDHGTACAGIIGATTSNGIGMSGLAPGVRVIPIQIAIPAVEDLVLVVNAVQMEAALQAAERAGAQIVSLSWGLQTTDNLFVKGIEEQIVRMNQARGNKGILVVSAAGNDPKGNDWLDPDFPANNFRKSPNLVSAGAVNWCGGLKEPEICDKEPWTTRRDTDTLFAPGVGIFTTTNRRNKTDAGAAANYRTNFNGTSAATPMIAGVAAVVWKKHADKNWNAGQLVEHLRKTGVDTGNGRIRVNLCNALYGKDNCE